MLRGKLLRMMIKVIDSDPVLSPRVRNPANAGKKIFHLHSLSVATIAMITPVCTSLIDLQLINSLSLLSVRDNPTPRQRTQTKNDHQSQNEDCETIQSRGAFTGGMKPTAISHRNPEPMLQYGGVFFRTGIRSASIRQRIVKRLTYRSLGLSSNPVKGGINFVPRGRLVIPEQQTGDGKLLIGTEVEIFNRSAMKKKFDFQSDFSK